ncbi:MAG: hypothetical protein JSV04_11295 [Candidatus Heimdallarchaeota archaeon]|nr:MAG: hypothetical protein JSV04_11295 [Candidatus Heimdallarchaeota archaeon]
MNRNIRYFCFGILLFLALSVFSSPVQAAQTPEWKVSVGDSKTYEVTKYYDAYLINLDGDPNKENNTVGGKTYTYEKDITIKVEITKLNAIAEVDETYYDEVTVSNALGTTPQGQAWVSKTIDNKTYWEDMIPDPTPTLNVTLDGNLIVTTAKMPWLFDATITWEYSNKINWKTGWLEYMYQTLYNSTGTLTEVEFSVKGAAAPGFELPTLLVGLFAATLVVLRKRR